LSDNPPGKGVKPLFCEPMDIPLDDGTTVVLQLVTLHASDADPNAPHAIFFIVHRTDPRLPDAHGEELGEFNWEQGRGYSEPTGNDVATVRRVIEHLKKPKR